MKRGYFKKLAILVALPFLVYAGYLFAAGSATDTGHLGNDQWHIQSDGDLVPDSDSSYDIGASGTEVSSIYVDTLVVGGDSVTGASQISTPMEDQGTYVRIAGNDNIKLFDNGNLTIVGVYDGVSLTLENDATLTNAVNNTVVLTENSDTLSIAFDGNDISLTASDGSIELVPETSAADGTIDFFGGGDSDDYIQVITAVADTPVLNWVGCDGTITAAGGDISFGDENLLTTGTLGAGAATFTSIAGVDTITGSTHSDVLSFASDDILSFTSNDNDSTIAAIGYTSKDAKLLLSADGSADAGDDWYIMVDDTDQNLEIFSETTEVINIAVTSGNIDMVTGTTFTMGNDEYFSNATNGTMQAGSSGDMIFEIYSSNTSDGDATLELAGDAKADATDRWRIVNDTGLGAIGFKNDQSVAGTFATVFAIAAADGDITTTGDIEIGDDFDLVLGAGGDWKVQYDEAVDDQLIFITANTAATATTDPLVEFLVGATPTADQQVFGVAKGTQASNTALFTVDEDGDIIAAGTGTIEGNIILQNDEQIDNSTDGTVQIQGDSDENIAVNLLSTNTSNGTAALQLSSDNATDAGDRWQIMANGSENLVFSNDDTTPDTFVTKLTIAGADGDITTTGDVEIIDDMDLVIGSNSDWKVQYDEAVDDQLLFVTAGTAATATTDPMFQIIVGGSPTADQQVFGVAKGTQASDTDLLTVDEDGDVVVGNDLTVTADATISGGDLTMASATSTKPAVVLENTTNDTASASIKLLKDKGAAGADGDDVGVLLFSGDDAAQTETDMAKIIAEVDEADDGNEAGSLTFQVMFDDGTPALESFLVLEGQAASTAGQGIIEINSSGDDVDTVIYDDAGVASLTVDAGTGATTVLTASTTASGLIVDANGATGATGVPALLIDSEQTDSASVYITGAQDATGTSAIFDDYTLAVANEGIGGTAHIYRNVASATGAVLQVFDDHADTTGPLALLTYDGDATADDNAVTIQTTSTAFDKSTLFIDRDTTTGATTEAAVKIDSEDPDSAALYILSAVDATGTTQNIDDYAVSIVSEGVGGGASIYRNVAAATEQLLRVQEVHVDSTAQLAVFTSAADASADDDLIEIAASSTAFDKTVLFINRDTTTGATLEPAVEIDNEDPDAASLLIRSANDASGTDADFDDFAVAISVEAAGGGLNIHRDLASGTEELLRVDSDHVDDTSPLAIFQTDQDDTADDAAVQIITTSASHDTSALQVTQAGTGAAIEIVSGALAVNGDSITSDGTLVIDATSATSFNDENITNVGQIDVDTVDADGSALALGDGDETVAIDSSDWDIDATGTMTGIGSITSNGTATITGGIVTAVVTVPDNATYSVNANDSGQIHRIVDQSQDVTITLPTEASGLHYTFVYGGAADDGHDWIIKTTGNSNWFLGGVVCLDPDDGDVLPVYADGNSNSQLTVELPNTGTRVEVYCDGTYWTLNGYVVTSTDTGAVFADQ